MTWMQNEYYVKFQGWETHGPNLGSEALVWAVCTLRHSSGGYGITCILFWCILEIPWPIKCMLSQGLPKWVLVHICKKFRNWVGAQNESG